MKRIIFSLAFFTIGLRMAAQQEYFVFIQEEAGQPFYVRMGEKNYSSSSSGHILIPSLKDSAYRLAIGFPKDRYPEQSFAIVMGQEDKGFDLKRTPDGWALYDLRYLQFIRPVADGQGGDQGAQGVKRTDAYSQLMAGLVNDSAVLYAQGPRPPDSDAVQKQLPVRQLSPAKAPALTAEKAEKDAVSSSPDSLNKRTASSADAGSATQTDIGQTQPGSKKQSSLAKGREADPKALLTDPAGFEPATAVQTDPAKTQADPKAQSNLIRSQRDPKAGPKPAASPGKAPSPGEAAANQAISGADPRAGKKHDIIQAGSYTASEWSQLIYIDRGGEIPDTIVAIIEADPPIIAGQARDADTAQAMQAAQTVEKPKLQVINSDCRNFAGEQDLDKLRVKILNEKEAYRKSMAAKTAFKAKCYSVKQVRALSELFDDDAGRYQFLETAYPYVSDTYNFAAMVDLFKTEYYISRFKKLTGK